MIQPILTIQVRIERDVVSARQRARQIAGLLGFEKQDQTRIATAVSEISRNAFQYAAGGKVEFAFAKLPRPALVVRVTDRGKGIPLLKQIFEGGYVSATGMGMGIIGVRRLMDRFDIDSTAQGTTVTFARNLIRSADITARDLATVAEELARRTIDDPYEDALQQNHDLMQTLEELQTRQTELAEANRKLADRESTLLQLNQELEDTNRGVVALYAELDEKADFLRRASEMKSRFLSNMSHEFRTPLNAMIGLTRLLLDRVDGELSPDQEKQVTLIRKAAQDLTEIVNDLLDLAKVEAGKVTVRPTEFDVGTLFGALRGMLRPLLTANSSVALVIDETEGMPRLFMDESKVSQILRNFISNALKFTEKGEVRVSAESGADGMVTFAVSDTGIGIAPEDQDRIFEEFAQVENHHQKVVRGTGLGLPLVRKLAGLLGGSVGVRSEVGVGSTFFARIPLRYEGPTEIQDVPLVASHIDPNLRPVLVVEDNRETVFIYDKYLRGTGFQVIPAPDLKTARQTLTRIRPVAIVLDILLDNENSWEFLGELKRSTATCDLPVLVVTLVENEAKALSLGADAFCVKPVDRSWFIARLNECAKPASGDVLIVDDDEASRYLMRQLLHRGGYTSIEASTAGEGLSMARSRRPPAIILDLELPDQNGLHVLATLKADPSTQPIPVIVNTAKRIGERERQSMLAAGAVDVLVKTPTDGEGGFDRLEAALHSAGLPTRTKSHG